MRSFFFAAALLFAFTFGEVSTAQDSRHYRLENSQSLPRTRGWKDVVDHCTPCHSERLVTQNRLTREMWDRTIDLMQDENGLWELDESVRNRILNYLEKHFAPPKYDSMDPELGPRVLNPLPL